MVPRAFTLIELLVVITIIAILAALLFPVFSRAKEESKKTACLSNMSQISLGDAMYLTDYDGNYPQTRQTSDNPDVQDAAGNIDEPVFGSPFDLIAPYVPNGKSGVDVCPSDPDPFGDSCVAIDPDAPSVTSFLVNAYFVFGLSEGQVPALSNTIMITERRSVALPGADPYCDNIYHPWFNSTNPDAPENEMDPTTGAVMTTRHNGMANYAYADTHVKASPWSATYSPPGVNLHLVKTP
jgi:prepilin-type N-terminal cleavage/methylation domain-containing protein/prepilin-type processing-associated H-X9-DG protein